MSQAGIHREHKLQTDFSLCAHCLPISHLEGIQCFPLLNYSERLQERCQLSPLARQRYRLNSGSRNSFLKHNEILSSEAFGHLSNLWIVLTENEELLRSQGAAWRWKHRIDRAPRSEPFWQLASRFLQAAGTYHWHLVKHYPAGAECHPVLCAGNNQEYILSKLCLSPEDDIIFSQHCCWIVLLQFES